MEGNDHRTEREPMSSGRPDPLGPRTRGRRRILGRVIVRAEMTKGEELRVILDARDQDHADERDMVVVTTRKSLGR